MIALALGGHALIHTDPKALKKHLKPLPKRSLVTHGNGPHVGELYVKTLLPLHVCVAQTQWIIGDPLAEALGGEVIMTRVLVNEDDPAFSHPAKPIGDYYKTKPKEKWDFIKTPNGWRRVVPSPEPKEILELGHIMKVLLTKTAIACGGGGIPVVKKGSRFVGVDAVIDKDLATQLLASSLGAEKLIIVTDEKGVFLDYGKKSQSFVSRISARELEKHFSKGQFPEGSMGPKVLASIKFVKAGGESAIITNLEGLKGAIKGKEGTVIT